MKSKFFLFLIFSTSLFAHRGISQNGSLIDSLKTALTTCQTTADSVKVLCELTWRTSETESDQVFEYGQLALEKAKFISDSSLISDAYDAAARAYKKKGDIEKAKNLYQISLEIGLRNKIKQRIAWSSLHLTRIYCEQQKIEQAAILARQSYKNFILIEDYNRATNAYWALVKTGQKQYEDTLARLITMNLPKIEDETEKLYSYIQVSNLYNKLEDRKKAMHYVQLAMELGEQLKDTKGIIKAYYQIADYFGTIQKNYSMALTYYEKILELFQVHKIKNNGDIFNQIGDMHRLMGNTGLALEYFNKALETGKTKKHRHTMASAYRKLGDVSYQNNSHTKALDYYLQCYETNCDVCPRIKFHNVLVNIGNVYLFAGQLGKAEEYYNKSTQLANDFSDARSKCSSLQAYSMLFEKKSDLSNAINYSLKALEMAKQGAFLEGQQTTAATLSKLYSKQKNYRQAFLFLSQSNSLSDSLQKANEIGNLAQLETYFDFKNLQVQRELDKVKSQQEISRQKLLRNFFFIGFALVILLVVLIYISYRRKKKANQELKKQKQEIELISEKLHQADKAKLQFYTNVSHEFKTPLTLILGIVEKLKHEIKDNKQLNIIRKNSLKLLQLVNHLLDLRKIDNSKMELKVKQKEINGYLQGVSGAFENIAFQKGITLKFETNDKQIMAWFDHDKMEKIFSNLLSNAIKYSRKDGWVLVKTKKLDDGFFEINVSDNGIGINEKEMKNIFNRFYRVPGSNNEGTGIGLALVKELTEVHKGKVWVEENKINGASFTIRIPIEKHFYNDGELLKNETEAVSWDYIDALDLEDEAHEGKPVSTVSSLNKKSMLIVEDNHDLRKFIADMFMGSFQILEAKDGKEGQKLALEFVPDIVISDVMMPNMSGIELVEALRDNIATSHIPIVLLTAKNDLNTHLSSLNKGVDDFISKPFDSVVLKSRVENLLRLRQKIAEKFSKEFKLQPREVTIENADQKFLQKAIDVIEKHISNPSLNVELLAMELSVSRTQLYRKLNALTDYPPKHFIRIIRLKRAAQILQQGQNNIAEVMDATGFSNYSFFNNCFKDLFGKYPKEYAIVSVSGNLN